MNPYLRPLADRRHDIATGHPDGTFNRFLGLTVLAWRWDEAHAHNNTGTYPMHRAIYDAWRQMILAAIRSLLEPVVEFVLRAYEEVQRALVAGGFRGWAKAA